MKKPISEIKEDSARRTIISQHSKFEKTVSVDGCFGSSNIGQMSGAIAREITKSVPNAFMRCPLAVLPEIDGPVQVLLHDDSHVVIDGCKARCLAKTYKKVGIDINIAYALDEDFSLEKGKGPDFDEHLMREIAKKIAADMEKNGLVQH